MRQAPEHLMLHDLTGAVSTSARGRVAQRGIAELA
jgi:hypothetical protein